MANLTTIPDHFAIMFENSWQLLLQQLDARLKDRVKLVQAQGASVRFNQMAPTTMNAVTTRGAATPQSDISMPARWAFPTPFDIASVIDEFDELFLGQVSNPSSEILQSQVAAYNRTVDSTIINAILNPATISTSGATTAGIPSTTTVPFDTTNQLVKVDRVPFGGTNVNSGLTIDKVRYAKYKLDHAEAPHEDRILVVSAAEIADLLSSTEVTNQLYNSVRALVDGDVDSFLGFKIVRSELLPVITSTTNTANSTITGNFRQVVAYSKNAVTLVDGGRKTYMDILPTQSHNLQIRSTAVLGATRLMENGAVQILTDTSKQ